MTTDSKTTLSMWHKDNSNSCEVELDCSLWPQPNSVEFGLLLLLLDSTSEGLEPDAAKTFTIAANKIFTSKKKLGLLLYLRMFCDYKYFEREFSQFSHLFWKENKINFYMAKLSLDDFIGLPAPEIPNFFSQIEQTELNKYRNLVNENSVKNYYMEMRGAVLLNFILKYLPVFVLLSITFGILFFRSFVVHDSSNIATALFGWISFLRESF